VGGPSFRFRADGPTVSTKVAFSNTKDRGRRDTHPLGDRSYATSAKECTNDNRHFATLLIATESWVSFYGHCCSSEKIVMGAPGLLKSET
jgi:hypothetical protein